jgi:hypothetical protein
VQRYSLKDIWEMAKEDSFAAALDFQGHEARLCYGIKIVYDISTETIALFNTAKGGDFYEELNDDELDRFKANGWRAGVYLTALDTITEKLEHLKVKIQNEIGTKNRHKQIKMYKATRENFLNSYRKIKSKLNQLNHEVKDR